MANVASLRKERDSVSLIYRNYLIEKSKGIRYHVFVEGSDDPSYYLHHIAAQGIDVMHTMIYKCHNKDGVLAMYFKMKSLKVNLNHIMFMKDKDYDDMLGLNYASDVFVTPSYAIESEMAGENVIRKIWLSCLRNLSPKSNVDDMLNKWRSSLRSFTKNFAEGFYAGLILLAKSSQPYNLEKAKISDQFEIKTDGRILFKRGKVTEIFNSVSDVSYNSLDKDELSAIKSAISQSDPKSYIVGKHILALFARFVENYIKFELPKTSPRTKCTIQVQFSNPVISFYAFTDAPPSLVA